jgi:Tol biopolymer transport system component
VDYWIPVNNAWKLAAVAALVSVAACGSSSGSKATLSSTRLTVAITTLSSETPTTPESTGGGTTTTSSSSAVSTPPSVRDNTDPSSPAASVPTGERVFLSVALEPGRGLLAAFRVDIQDDGITLFDASTGEQVGSVPAYGKPIWSPDGTRIAVLDQRGNGLEIVDLAAGTMTTITDVPLAQRVTESPGTQGDVVGWSPDGSMIAYSFESVAWQAARAPGSKYKREFHVVNVDGSGNVTLPYADAASATSLDSVGWSSDGRLVAIVNPNPAADGPGDFTLVEIDPTTGSVSTELRTFTLPHKFIFKASISTALDVAAFITFPFNAPDGIVTVVDLQNGDVRYQLNTSARDLAFSADAGRLAYVTTPTGGPDGELHLLDLTSGVDRILASGDAVGYPITWSPSGQIIAASGPMVDTETGEITASLYVPVDHAKGQWFIDWRPQTSS